MVGTMALGAMRVPDGGRPSRWRLACAVTVSVLLHLTGLWWAVLREPAVRAPIQPARQAMEVLWILDRPAAQALAPLPAPSEPGEARRPQDAAPRPAPVSEARSARSPAAPVPPEGTGQGMAAISVPLPAASDARDEPAVHWSPEGVARAARQEREWQRRHGPPAAAALAAGAAGSAPRPLGTLSEKEWNNAYAGRVTRVESEAGVYCVRLPSANRLPEVGAAPRIATVTN